MASEDKKQPATLRAYLEESPTLPRIDDEGRREHFVPHDDAGTETSHEEEEEA